MNFLDRKDKNNIPLIAAIIVVATVVLTIAASAFVWQFAEQGFKQCYESGGHLEDSNGGWHSECVYD